MALIELRRVDFTVGGPLLLESVDLAIEPGERVCVVGRNGTGKTTLLRLLAGEIRPDDGELYVDEQLVKYTTPSDARKDGIALIAQELALVPHLTVMQNVFLGVEPRHRGFVARREMQRQYADLVERWGGSPLGVQWQGRGTVRRRLGPRTPVDGLYAAGSHTAPGAGLPYVGLSASLVAQVVGPAG